MRSSIRSSRSAKHSLDESVVPTIESLVDDRLSTNISDVTLTRASRVTSAVTGAQAALTDAMAARDRECKGEVGKFCRDREAEVAERCQILDTAMASVGQTADPQTEAAIKLVAWASHGTLRPVPEDFVMLRLVLLALLPQVGGSC
jgi:hypothetical protein